jgi:hypothetical protein
MVKTKHVLKGLKRYAREFKSIMEDPHLPPVEDLAVRFSELTDLSPEERKMKLSPMLSFLLKESGRGKPLARPAFAKAIREGQYFAQMSDEQIDGILFLEEMKCILDRGCRVPVIRSASRPLARENTIRKK